MDPNWGSMSSDERLAQRLDVYVNMPGFEFSGDEAAAKYRERTTIIRDAFEMKVPAQVPYSHRRAFSPSLMPG
jgi:hypothetical protein